MTALDQEIVLVGTPSHRAVERARCAAAGCDLSAAVPLSAGGLAVSVNMATGERGKDHGNPTLCGLGLPVIAEHTPV